MPRKKKTFQSQMPPLLFVNSPDFQPVAILTPDLAVDNPVTARPVPVENMADNSWVSPQFHNCRGELSNCQNSRWNRPYRSNTLTHAKHRIDENDRNECSKKLKFKPLQFFNDNNSDSGIPTASFTGVTCLDMNNIVVHTPNFTQQHTCDVEHVSQDSRNAVIDAAVKNCNSNCQDSEVTPRRVFRRAHTGIQKLLQPNNLFTQDSSVNSEKPKQHNYHLDNIPVVRELNSSEMHEKNILNTAGNVLSCLPQIIDHGTANQLTRLISRTSQVAVNQPAVLVNDTPECDYSLSFKQRQLKYR